MTTLISPARPAPAAPSSVPIGVYAATMRLTGGFVLPLLLRWRARRGKEDPARIGERQGRAGLARPTGPLVWIYGASVGEAQSALPLVERILAYAPTSRVLVTTGTVTSATLMTARLPPRAMHQYYPLDHPAWVEAFLNHWKPDAALWMELELWPCMLRALRVRRIPAALVNARLSARSARRWGLIPRTAYALLETFRVCLAQSEADAHALRSLNAPAVSAPGNLKFSAAPLPGDPDALAALRAAIGARPVWVYASTHAGEEEMACRVHRALKPEFPGLLTLLVPRHPERGARILEACAPYGLRLRLRGAARALPAPEDDVYVADTLGELGVFYRLSPLACVGRSFSDDGGGGHNPIEPARLGCAVLHGPAVQNLAQIYGPMDEAGAARRVADEAGLVAALRGLLNDPQDLKTLQQKGAAFAREQDGVIDRVMEALSPVLSALP